MKSLIILVKSKDLIDEKRISLQENEAFSGIRVGIHPQYPETCLG
jgi:hypothetical protein